jgi:hypothetical protein
LWDPWQPATSPSTAANPAARNKKSLTPIPSVIE